MAGLSGGDDHRMAIGVELGPVEVDDELSPASQYKWDPDGEHLVEVEHFIANEAVDLFDGVSFCLSLGGGEAPPDDMDGQGASDDDAGGGVGYGGDALGVNVVVEQVVNAFFEVSELDW